ncbi:OsmC family protein [bacterium]|nr:OsmC family protein [bacterium]
MELIRAKGLTLLAKADSGHWITFDAHETVGGNDAAIRPFETFLSSLAGCTAMDVLSILNKMRVKVADFKMNLFVNRAEQHPKIPTEVLIEYLFVGDDIPDDKVEKAIKLSQDKYCSVSAVVKKAGIPINWYYKIVSEADE